MSNSKPLTERIEDQGGLVALAAYERAGGYSAARQALTEMTPLEVQELVKEAIFQGINLLIIVVLDFMQRGETVYRASHGHILSGAFGIMAGPPPAERCRSAHPEAAPCRPPSGASHPTQGPGRCARCRFAR